MGLIPLFLCSAASCLEVNPAHTPCISAGGYCSAYSKHGSLTSHPLHTIRAWAM